MNKRLAKITAAFGAAAALSGITGCSTFANNADPASPSTSVPDPAPAPTSHTYYFNDPRTDLCFSATFENASRGYGRDFTNVECANDVKRQIAAAAPYVAEKMDITDIGYNRDINNDTCLAGNSETSTTVPCTDKVMALVPAGNTGGRIEPATIPQIEGWNTGSQDDLDASIPGTGIALGGDNGNPGYPVILVPGAYQGRNPVPAPPNHRALPTGTAVGPHGEHYGFYAIVPFAPNPAECTYTCYTSADTVVVDLAHPGRVLFTLRGISQASGAYDAQSDRMIILGNTLNGDRALWQSDPVGQNAAWGDTLQSLGTFSTEMNANRESQIVALPSNNGRGGGFLVVGAGEGTFSYLNYQLQWVTGHCTSPIEAATASTPQGLLTAPVTALVRPETLPGVYGPTITDIQEINGKEVVTLRVSTFGPAPDRYDPHTYKSAFTITPPRVYQP